LFRGSVPGLFAVAALIAWASPASAAESASAPTGGARGPSAIPKLATIACRRECGSHTRSASRRSRPVVHARSVLTIRGRDMQTVQKVVFLGRRGSRDDVLVTPSKVSARGLTVTVPASASTGRIAAITSDGWSSKPTRTTIGVHRHAPPPPPPGTEGERLIWPVRGPITGRFGEDRGSHYHAGIDISADGGTPIKAAAAGEVVLRGWESGYGNYTCVAHAAITTCYAHQSRFGTTKGATVTQGQVIGYVGNTGNSRGNHLHFEVRRGTKPWGTPLDPLRYLP
jgi:murein DD-endopeptidase MepM/ murein hydrolase activator NlpD